LKFPENLTKNLPLPLFAKEGNKKIYLLISPFEKGGLRGI